MSSVLYIFPILVSMTIQEILNSKHIEPSIQQDKLLMHTDVYMTMNIRKNNQHSLNPSQRFKDHQIPKDLNITIIIILLKALILPSITKSRF